LKLQPRKGGQRVLRLDSKKTEVIRYASISETSYNADENFIDASKASLDTIMFTPGEGRHKTSKWCKKISRFFRKRGIEGVQTHDFRATLATDLYKASNHDLIKVKTVLGHSKIETSAGYVKANIVDTLKTMRSL
jgi:integrase